MCYEKLQKYKMFYEKLKKIFQERFKKYCVERITTD